LTDDQPGLNFVSRLHKLTAVSEDFSGTRYFLRRAAVQEVL
jgi:hypothetical protein